MRTYVLSLLFACSLSAVPRYQVEQSPSTTVSVSATTLVKHPAASTNALSALAEVGSKNRIPIGIVVEGRSLCTAHFTGSDETVTIGELVEELKSRIPDYTAEIKNNTLFIHPRAMTVPTIDALNLMIPRFTSQPGNIHALRISLWMFIRAVLVPQQGSAFEGEIPGGAEKLPPIQISNSTVEDILDRIVTAGQGGLWVLQEVPIGWQTNPNSIPYDLYSYSDWQRGVANIRCSR